MQPANLTPITAHITVITVGGKTDQYVLDTILIKVASRCNINCSYCYVFNMGDDNYLRQQKLISHQTIEAIMKALHQMVERQERPFSIVLHGGEPLLIGPARLEHLLFSLRKVLPHSYPISVQTNGMLITDAILDICSSYLVSVAVSLDGPRHVHDNERVDHQGKPTFDAVVKGYSLVRTHQHAEFLNAGLLAVIDPTSDPAEIYRFFKSTGAPSVDFLYKDGNHNRLPQGKQSITSLEYGLWMSQLMEVYLADAHPMPIRVLDDMMKVLLGGMVTKEGLGLNNFGILVIDTDGTLMKNDTLKSAYNGADKFKSSINIKDVDLFVFIHSDEFNTYREMQRPTAIQCLTCEFLDVCGGGMLLHRWKEHSDFNNPSIYCADQLHLITHMRSTIQKLVYHA